jgi:hypothetical protein
VPGWQVPPPQQPPRQIEWFASPHALSHWPVVVLQAAPMGQSPAPLQNGIGVVVVVVVVVVVIVVVVVGQVSQSPGHVEQSSEGPQSPSPHTQLQGGELPEQLHRPFLQSAVIRLKHLALRAPVRPLAATSSLQALRRHGEKAVASETMVVAPRASTANPVSTFRAAMGGSPASPT